MIERSVFIGEPSLQVSLIKLLLITSFFIGSNLATLIIPYAFQATFFFSLLLCILFFRSDNKFSNLQVSILLWCSYLVFGTLVSSCTHNSQALSMLLKNVLSLIVILFLSLTLKPEQGLLIFVLSSKLVLIMALMGIVGFVIELLGVLPVLKTVNIGNRFYEFRVLFFNILGQDSLVHVMGRSLYRLQGWFDEPGSFAFVLLPAIIFFAYEHKWIPVAILCIALLLSFSFGGIMALALVVAIHFISSVKRPVHLSLLILIIVIIAVFPLFFPDQATWAIDYVHMKLGVGEFKGSFTSFGVRQNEYGRILATLTQFPFGTDGGTAFLFNRVYFSSGIVSDLTVYGIIGFVIRIGLEISLLMAILKALSSRSRLRSMASFVVISLLLMGYQRMTFLRTYYFMVLMITSLVLMKKGSDNGKM